jgi:hypothetical protein
MVEVELYHERWELGLGYDEIKTELLDREEAIRSRKPDEAAQELGASSWRVPSSGSR